MAELVERPPASPEEPSPTNSTARFKRSPLGQTIAIRSFRFYWTSTFFYFLVFGTQRFVFIWLVLELRTTRR